MIPFHRDFHTESPQRVPGEYLSHAHKKKRGVRRSARGGMEVGPNNRSLRISPLLLIDSAETKRAGAAQRRPENRETKTPTLGPADCSPRLGPRRISFSFCSTAPARARRRTHGRSLPFSAHCCRGNNEIFKAPCAFRPVYYW